MVCRRIWNDRGRGSGRKGGVVLSERAPGAEYVREISVNNAALVETLSPVKVRLKTVEVKGSMVADIARQLRAL